MAVLPLVLPLKDFEEEEAAEEQKSKDNGGEEDITSFFQSPDLARLIMDFAAGSLLELLSSSMLNSNFHKMAVQRIEHEMRCLEPPGHSLRAEDFANMMRPQAAQQFINLPGLELNTRPDPAYVAWNETEEVLHCVGCATPILGVSDIESTRYRIMTGDAYLANALHNITVAAERMVVQYTSGTYTVSSVACSHCALRLGTKYVGAEEGYNHYKVGKFLVGQDLFEQQACCKMGPQRQATGIPPPMCGRCRCSAARGSLQLVRIMTEGFQPGCMRYLYELMSRQKALETLAVPRIDDAVLLLAPPRQRKSWCMPLPMPIPRSQESIVRLSLSSLGTTHGLLHSASQPASWRDAFLLRFGMLVRLQGELADEKHLIVSFCKLIRFLDCAANDSTDIMPKSVDVWGGRKELLARMVPAFLGCGDPSRFPAWKTLLRNARTLVLALRREWVLSRPAKGGSLGDMEMRVIIREIVSYSAQRLEGGYQRERINRVLQGLRNPECDPSARNANVEFGPEDEVHQCYACGTNILTTADILSGSYRIMAGHGFFARDAGNVIFAEETKEVQYSSGRYLTQTVFCGTCQNELGVKYAGAFDMENEYKVGKFLLAQDQLLCPPLPAFTTEPPDEMELHTELWTLARLGCMTACLPKITTGTTVPSSELCAPPAAPQEPSGVGSVAVTPTEAANYNIRFPAPWVQAAIEARRLEEASLAAPPPQPRRIFVTIQRYMNCILPAVRNTYVLRPWTTRTATTAAVPRTATAAVHPPLSMHSGQI